MWSPWSAKVSPTAEAPPGNDKKQSEPPNTHTHAHKEAKHAHDLKTTDKPGVGHILHPQEDEPPPMDTGARSSTYENEERPQDVLFRRRTSQFFFVTNCIHICFGIVTLILIQQYAEADHERLEPYFYYLQMYHDIIALIICVSGVGQAFAGIIGLMWTNCFKCVPCPIKLFSSYENYLNIVLTLNVGASFVVAMIGARPIHKMLDDVMLTEAYHWSHHPKFNKTNWEYLHTITRVQMEMQCCGLHDFRDWYFSPGHFIPESCCNTETMQDCQNALATYDVANTGTSRDIGRITLARMQELRTNVVPLLWPKNCIEALQDVVTEIRVRWAVIICVIIFFQTFLFGWSSFLSRYIRIHLQYEKDVKKMLALKSKLKLWDSIGEAHFATDAAETGEEPPPGYMGIAVPETKLEHQAENIYEMLHKRRETLTKGKEKTT